MEQGVATVSVHGHIINDQDNDQTLDNIMRNASLIRYDISKIQRTRGTQELINPASAAATDARLAKLEADLVTAERRELKRLAKHLTYKADVYTSEAPGGRIYSFDAKWHVAEVDGKPALFHGTRQLDREQLCDGHGQYICIPD